MDTSESRHCQLLDIWRIGYFDITVVVYFQAAITT